MNSSGAPGSYSFKLSDGSGWQISATPDASSFITKFASIFGLEHGDGPLNKYTFTKTALPSDGWSLQKMRSVEIWSNERSQDIICKINEDKTPELEIFNISYAMYPIYRKIIENGGAPFHSALVERDGKGVILAAKGDTGKSTCARRIPPPWKALGDDECLAVKTGENTYNVHPFPTWSNFVFDRPQRTWDVQHHAKLSGIFFIEQAPVDEATLLGQGEGAIRIYGASLQVMGRMVHSLSPQDQASLKKQLFFNACEISKAMPCYSLKVLLDGKFWEEIEKVL